MIAITGVSGQLGLLVIENLLKEIKPSRLIEIVRNPEKVADLKALGVEVRKAGYSRADLAGCFTGRRKTALDIVRRDRATAGAARKCH